MFCPSLLVQFESMVTLWIVPGKVASLNFLKNEAEHKAENEIKKTQTEKQNWKDGAEDYNVTTKKTSSDRNRQQSPDFGECHCTHTQKLVEWNLRVKQIFSPFHSAKSKNHSAKSENYSAMSEIFTWTKECLEFHS